MWCHLTGIAPDAPNLLPYIYHVSVALPFSICASFLYTPITR